MFLIRDVIKYHESFRLGKFKPLHLEVLQLKNKVKTANANKIIDDMVEHLFNYFIKNNDFIEFNKKGQEQTLRLMHNLELANLICLYKDIFEKKSLVELVMVALVHNLPLEETSKIMDSIVAKYCLRFEEKFKERLFKDQKLMESSEEVINEVYQKELQESTNKFPANIRKVFETLELFKKYKKDDCPLIANENFDEFMKARFIFQKYNGDKDLLKFFLCDAVVSAQSLSDNILRPEITVYDVLRYVSLILGQNAHYGSEQDKILSKRIPSQLRKRTIDLRKNNPKYQEVFRLIKNKIKVDYYQLFDLSKDFLNEQIVPVYSKAVTKGLISEDAILYVEDRIKDIEKIRKNKEEGKNIKDLVAYRIICRSMEDAWRIKKLFDEKLGLQENKTRFKDFHKKPKESGYADVLHSTYENVLGVSDEHGNVLKSVPVEIQFVGGEEAHLRNQRGEGTNHLTHYSHGYRQKGFDDKLIFADLGSLPKHFGTGGFFMDIKNEQKALDVICNILESSKNGLPKKLNIFIKKNGIMHEISAGAELYNYNYELQPGEILVFKQNSDIDKEIKDNFALRKHRKMVNFLSDKRIKRNTIELKLVNTGTEDNIKLDIPIASTYAAIIKYLKDNKMLPNRFRMQGRNAQEIKYRDIKDIKAIPQIGGQILITARKKGENHANFNIKDSSLIKELDMYSDETTLAEIKIKED